MSESPLYGEIMREYSRGNTRIFRQQAGLFWSGKIIYQTHDRITLLYPRAVKVGTPGLADLGGVTSVLITPEMVGSTVGVDVQIEVKFGRNRLSPEQRNYIAAMQALGARAGIARSIEEAGQIITDMK